MGELFFPLAKLRGEEYSRNRWFRLLPRTSHANEEVTGEINLRFEWSEQYNEAEESEESDSEKSLPRKVTIVSKSSTDSPSLKEDRPESETNSSGEFKERRKSKFSRDRASKSESGEIVKEHENQAIKDALEKITIVSCVVLLVLQYKVSQWLGFMVASVVVALTSLYVGWFKVKEEGRDLIFPTNVEMAC